jgi:hypothetical protein
MARIVPPQGSLGGEVADLRRRIAALERASSFTLSGTSVTAEGAQSVDGSMTVTGDLAVQGAFSLPDASVQDAWLATLVGWGSVPAVTTTAWATSASFAVKATTSLTVPAGFTTALVIGWGLVVFQDSAPNRFDSRVTIEGNVGPALINLANLVASSTVLHSAVLTVTGGQVLNLSVDVLTAAATAGMPANQAVIGGVALYRR